MDPQSTIKRVVIVGQGYVGLPLAMATCQQGHNVIGLDLDIARVEALSSGKSFVEDVADSDLRTHLKSGLYRVASNYSSVERFDVAIITVPTPLTNGLPDLSYIRTAAKELASYISQGSLVILESTTYPGTTVEVLIPILEGISGLKSEEDFLVGYSPERIDPGNRHWSILNTPKVVSGHGPQALKETARFYDSLGIPTVSVSSTEVAELTKLLENTFRHVNIALINELSVFASELDVDIWEAIDAASTKPFGFMRFSPGPGVGGHCLPIDPSYLSWKIQEQTGKPFQFVELANAVNSFMPEFVVARLSKLLGSESLAGRAILLVGLAYKPNTGDVRESPSLEVAKRLNDRGARVFGIDPLVAENHWPAGVENVAHHSLTDPAAAVILANHDIVDLSVIQATVPLILDTRNCLEGSNVFPL